MAVAKWLIHVDWNGDGDFSDANEDVTSDVLGVTLEHFRDLSSGHMEAARLELQLKNDDHKYSPPNGSLPLSGNLKPGRTVWVRAAYPYDAFSDVAGTQLADHTLDNDSDFSWTEYVRRNNDELVATFGNLVHRVLTMSHRNFEGQIPHPGALDDMSQSLLDEAHQRLAGTASDIRACRFRAALNDNAMALAQSANRYLDRKECGTR